MSDTAVNLEYSEHDPHLQHHFTLPEQQLDASKMGMFLFLVTEILLFGGLFVGFSLMQAAHSQAFLEAHHELNKTLGFINTLVLLSSSYTMVMAVHSARVDNRRKLILFLALTMAFSAVFLGIKYIEYSHDFAEGLYPGKFFAHKGPHAVGQAMFFSFYFMMTGLHGIHILVGMAAMTWLLRRSIRGDFSSRYNTPVDLVGLYWHLVDVIWIYLFPLLYLIR